MDKSLGKFKKIAEGILDQELLKQTETGEVSSTHSKSHLTITANLTQLVGKIYKFSEQELFLVYFAALFHDLVRSPSQDKDLQDEQLNAQQAVELLENFEVSDEEKMAVSYAIINHGSNPSWMENPSTRETSPQSLKEKIRFALYVADKIEQNGVRVIARRSAFVAGERLNKKNGDLRAFGFKPKKDELLVVALESALRLTFINPEIIYPQRLKSIVKPLYVLHRAFVYGILKALNLSVYKLAQIILETKRVDGKNLKEVRKMKDISDLKDLSNLIKTKGQLSDEQIQNTNKETSEAAKEAVAYFSSHYAQDIDQLMLNWKPENEIAKTWQREMVEYLDGTWFNEVGKSI